MIKKVNRKSGSFNNLMSELPFINLENPELICQTVYFKYKITVNQFLYLYGEYASKRKYDEGREEFIGKIVTILNKYDSVINKEYNDVLRPMLLKFMDSDCLEINKFFADKKLLEKAVEYALILDYDFYQIFFCELEKKEMMLKQKNIEAGNRIIDEMKSMELEAEENGSREFDLIDYYMNTDLEPKKMVLLLRYNAAAKDLLILKKFASRYVNDYALIDKDIENKLNDRTIYRCQFDEKGEAVPGSGFEISDADKLFVLDYLVNNNIPITECTYSAGLRRFRNGVFTHISDDEKKFVME